MGMFMMLRLGLVLGAMAVVGGFIWDYQATKSALKETRLDLSAVRAELAQAEIARDVALEFGEEQAERASQTRATITYIRRRPDGNEAAADIILDTIGGLRADAGSLQTSED